MDINILDTEFNQIAVVDTFTSLICCKRFYDIGALDLQIEATTENIELFQRGNYITRDDDDSVYRIEALELDTSTDEEKNFLIVGATDIKSILRQRIVWNQFNFKGTVENYIRALIINEIINPTDTTRKIENFALKSAKGFIEQISEQVTYDNVAEKIIEVCKTYGYGWKVTLENGVFKFDLFKGQDRSISQNVNPPVLFSPEFENFYNSKYKTDGTNYKNVALSAGEGEGIDREIQVVGLATGLNRFELYVDAKDISSKTEDPDFVYEEALVSKGTEELAKVSVTTSFEGEIDISSYLYKTDYNLGDVVTLQNEYGIGVNARITEIIETWDSEGYTVEPTFDELATISQELLPPQINTYNLYDGKRASFVSNDARVLFHYTVDGTDPTTDSPCSASVDLSNSDGYTTGVYTVKVIAVRGEEISEISTKTITLLKAETPIISSDAIDNGWRVSFKSTNATTFRYSLTGDVTEESTAGSYYDHLSAGTINIRVRAWRNGYLPSEQSSQRVTLSSLSAPVFTETPVLKGKIISWSSANASYYKFTTNGSPVSEGSEVGSSITLKTAGTITLRVRAWGKGALPSVEISRSVNLPKLPLPTWEMHERSSTEAYNFYGDIYGKGNYLLFGVSSEREIVVNHFTESLSHVNPKRRYTGTIYFKQPSGLYPKVTARACEAIGYADSDIAYFG